MTKFTRFDDFDFSWYACDQDGHVAAFSTGGSRIVPVQFSELSDNALFMLGDGIARISRSDGSFKGRGIPVEGVWELGFFAYVVETPDEIPTAAGVYELRRAPVVPLFNIEIDEKILENMRFVRFHKLCFSKAKTITKQMIRDEGIRLLGDS